ncbi:MAG: nicotinate-nucleotide adenylyltransferase [Candidatus Latescibacteria bacterium]|nr:nicotinate-nucleotide adenylyltransferase [Candidatus Latescibacterota bacterium]
MSGPARRIGIFGGTFDPVHNGHLIIAAALHERAGLDTVLFVPSARPPHKGSDIRFSAEERLHMLMLAVEGDPRFSISDIELRREGPSYTIDTIREIKRSLDNDTDVLFIVGMDNLYEIGMWKDPKGIVDECRILAARRVCDADGDVPEWLMRRVTVVDAPLVEISSSDIRKRLREGRSIRYLVPGVVRKAIESFQTDSK